MKRAIGSILGLFVILHSLSLFSAEFVLVEDLGDGACLVQENKSHGVFKVASFNDEITWFLDQFVLQNIRLDLSQKLKPIGVNFHHEPMETFIHCGGYGGSVVLNIDMNDFRVCAWGAFEKGNSIKLRSMGVTKNSGPCDGSMAGVLMVYTQSYSVTDQVVSELQEDKWKVMIDDVQKRSDSVVALRLSKKYWFSEEKVIQEVMSNLGKDLVRFIEMESFFHPIGEFKEVDTTSI